MIYEIENNIPIPPREEYKKESMYPFKKMNIGDSFFMPVRDNGNVDDLYHTAYAAVVGFRRRTEIDVRRWQFEIRRIKTDPKGIRIWRTQ